MGKIPSYLNPPGDPETLTDLVVFEWSHYGMHQGDVHRWACEGRHTDQSIYFHSINDRVDYLLELLECLSIIEPLTELPLHPDIVQWRSIALMTINLLNGGGTASSVKYPCP